MEEVAEFIPEAPAMDYEKNSDSPNEAEASPPVSASEIPAVASQNSSPVDEDDEGDEEVVAEKVRSGKRSRAIFDSDSEDDDAGVKGNEPEADGSEDDTLEKVKKSKSSFSRVTVESESDSDKDDHQEENELTPGMTELKPKSTKISSLIDSESEDESSRPDPATSPLLDESSSPRKTDKSKKPKINQSKRAAKDEALTKIRSETQRLIRESSVSLPYHRPKQRTLDDFLNRKRVSSSLPKAPTTANRLKISATIINQVLEEKEKEAEKFYQSSDSEEEPEGSPQAPEQPSESEKSIEDTQKLQKIDVHNRQQIIHNGSLEFGVPRKLFMNGGSPVPPATTLDDKIDELGNLPHKEVKRGLKEASMPRKLFDDDFEEGAGTPEVHQEFSPLDSGISSTIPQQSSPEDIFEASEDVGEVLPPLGEVPESPEEPSASLNDKIEENHEKSDDCAISETPIVSNKEFMKLNARNCPLNNSKNPDQVEDKEVEEPDIHVVALPHPEDNSKERNDFVTPQMTTTNPVPPAAPQVIKKAVLLNAPTSKPKLRGAPGMMIDLTNTSRPDKAAIDSLVDRFLTKHSAAPKNEDKETEVTILNTEITPDGLKVIKDTLSYKVRGDRCEDSDLNKPGAKLLKLKEELQKKMAVKRHEEWKQREREAEDSEDEDEENEAEEKVKTIDDEGEDEGESEPEEDDVVIQDKRRETNAFGDDEAEVSGDDDDDELDEDDEEAEDMEEVEEVEEADEDHSDDNDEGQQDLNKSKKFSRIIQVEEDSDDESPNQTSPKKTFERTNTDVDIFAEEEEMEGIQPSQRCESPSASSKPFSLGSPLSEFTLLTSQSASASKNRFSNTQISDFSPSIMLSNSPKPSSPSGELESVTDKLFEQDPSPINDQDLFDLCSGKFPDTDVNTQTSTRPNLRGLVDSSSSGGVSESQLLGLCSGTFATQPEVAESNLPEIDDTFRLTVDDPEKIADPKTSQEEEIPRNPLDIVSSSEDEVSQDSGDRKKKTGARKKRVRKLVLSDDEDEDEIDEYTSGESEAEENPEEEKFVDYDSEENEVVIIPKKDIKKVAANYLEEEAELSESEWGSEDEDERDLDKYEMEEADTEVIDEALMRDQIGKIHARQLLDEDNRDVRMLKEMLFDDGDLHEDGQGRERKFRWKNIDKIGLEDGPTNDEDVGEDENHEGESELEWRKLRMERQRFLEEKSKNEGENELAGGQLFSLGLKALKRNHTSVLETSSTSVLIKKAIVPRSVSELMQCSSKSSRIINTASKRGSFLSRGDEVLARLAQMTRQTDVVGLAPKKGANFVFTHLSPSVAGASEATDDEETEDMPKGKITKKRKITPGLTPTTRKKAKVDGEHSSAKKLF